jgi:hypothetical protein
MLIYEKKLENSNNSEGFTTRYKGFLCSLLFALCSLLNTQCSLLFALCSLLNLSGSHIISLLHHLAYFTLPPQAPKGDVKIGIRIYQ